MSERGAPGTWQWLAMWSNGALDVGATAAGLPGNDVDAARLLATELAGWLHHVPVTDTWYIWDGRCHRPDDCDRASQLCQDFGDRMQQALDAARAEIWAREYLAAGGNPDNDAKARAAAKKAYEDGFGPAQRYATGLKRTAGWRSLLGSLAAVCGTEPETMEQGQPYLINFLNGTLNLRTGELRGHWPADLLTHCLDYPYTPGVCPAMFWRLLCRAVGGDRDTAVYLAKVLGYCLLGENPKQQIFFITGPTSSGKTTLLEIVSAVLGPLAHASQLSLITLTRHGRNARVENSIRGRRLVTITEASSYLTVDEGQLKRLTGERRISVDQHYAKTELATWVTWTIVVATNQLPGVGNFDDAVKRRVTVIPGGPTIPAAERDEKLASRITAAEAGAIASFLADACVDVERSGLEPPISVQVKTGEYAAEQNTLANWIAERCMMVGNAMWNGGPGPAVPAHVGSSAAWKDYLAWSEGAVKLSRNEFLAQLRVQPGVVWNEGMRRFEGIVLVGGEQSVR